MRLTQTWSYRAQLVKLKNHLKVFICILFFSEFVTVMRSVFFIRRLSFHRQKVDARLMWSQGPSSNFIPTQAWSSFIKIFLVSGCSGTHFVNVTWVAFGQSKVPSVSRSLNPIQAPFERWLYIAKKLYFSLWRRSLLFKLKLMLIKVN